MKHLKLILGVLVVVLVLGFWASQNNGQSNLSFWSFMPQAVTVVFGPKEIKTFTMIDHNNQKVTQDNYAGKYQLTFFGYTYCPDVCPTSLSDMSQVLDILGPKGDNIIPLFVSVDPKRDTPEQLKEYLENFHPKFVGLTGTKEQISAMAKNYKAAYVKMTSDDNDPETYFMGHTSTLFLTGPDQQLITSFNREVKPETIAATIENILQR